VDAGVEEGGKVTPFYDPMIAKLIAHADTREAAAERLADAARSVEVWPVKTNAAFLARCAGHPDFVAARIDTGFIEARLDALIAPSRPAIPPGAVAKLARQVATPAAEATSPWSPLGSATGFRLNQSPARTATIYADGAPVEAPFDFHAPPAGIGLPGGDVVVFSEGAASRLSAHQPVEAAGAGALLDGAVLTPMPGRIVAVAVTTGEAVTAGQTLVVLEAMKMEHALTASAEGRVKELRVAVGDQVSEGTVAVRLEPID
jgi:acetyl/propionyl-CoA carboxylase alpha subunit